MGSAFAEPSSVVRLTPDYGGQDGATGFMGLMRLMGRLISPIGPIRVCSRRLAPPKRDQFPLAANFACFLAGLACGEPEGCDCGLGVGLLFGLFMAIS
jgi:hypothetical protein